MTQKILVIDDEPAMRHMLRLVLEKEGYQVVEAGDGNTGLGWLERTSFDAVLCDIRMPDMDGLNFLSEMEARKRSETLIMMSAYGSVDIAIRCMKLGAYDYIAKPFKPDEVVLTLRKAEERQRLRRENARLKEELLQQPPARKLVFRSAAMTALAELISRVAAVSSPVLITGETGTGKELVARALHQQSPRQHAPFIAINCSAIAASLIESELFGHTKGAYTGADREHPGLFAAADGGTLFLDEIGELPLELQPKLLRVLQEKEVRPIGDTKPIKVDVRVLAATGRDLGEEIAHGRFRNDLFYRLAVVEIHVPPLRERLEDIPLLIKFFLQRLCVREGRRVPVLTGRAVARLQTYNWPGNVRELENLMEKTLILCRGEKIDMGDLPFEMYRNERHIGESLSLKQASARLEREYIQKALAVTDGNRTQAAKLLEISLRGLLYKMKELDIGMQK